MRFNIRRSVNSGVAFWGVLMASMIIAITARGADGTDGNGRKTSGDADGIAEDTYMVIDLSAGSAADSYPVTYLSAVPEGGWTDEHKTVKLLLRRIPAGSLMIEGRLTMDGKKSDKHEITISRDFYVGVFEVTQKQWELVMGDWPAYFDSPDYRDARPVERVSYHDIRGADAGTAWPENNAVDPDSFVGSLRQRTGLKSLDLPTEAQWEYACRAGTTTAFNTGENVTGGHCPNMDVVGRYIHNGGAQYAAADDPSVGTAIVGSYLPNEWGLYDMHGNVDELCLDRFTRRRILDKLADPRGIPDGILRVRRGGSWLRHALDCTSTARQRVEPDKGFVFVGFRVFVTGQ